MTRRTLLQTLAALPLCGWLRPAAATETGCWLVTRVDSTTDMERRQFGFVDYKIADALGIFPALVFDADGNELKYCRSFNDVTGEVVCYPTGPDGKKLLQLRKDMKDVETITLTVKLPLKIVRLS